MFAVPVDRPQERVDGCERPICNTGRRSACPARRSRRSDSIWRMSPEVDLRDSLPAVEGPYTDLRCYMPPDQRRSMASIRSAPAHIAAFNVVSFGPRFAAPDSTLVVVIETFFATRGRSVRSGRKRHDRQQPRFTTRGGRRNLADSGWKVWDDHRTCPARTVRFYCVGADILPARNYVQFGTLPRSSFIGGSRLRHKPPTLRKSAPSVLAADRPPRSCRFQSRPASLPTVSESHCHPATNAAVRPPPRRAPLSDSSSFTSEQEAETFTRSRPLDHYGQEFGQYVTPCDALTEIKFLASATNRVGATF